MNHDENSSDMQAWIEPELEARVVAWASGEASAFEVAELERLVREKPELGLFKRRIEAVRGLVADAVRPEQAPMRLAPERRKKLLETLGGGDSATAPKDPTAPAPTPATGAPVIFPDQTKRRRRAHPAWLLGLAACLCFGLFAWVTLPPVMSRKALPVQEVQLEAEPAAVFHVPPSLQDSAGTADGVTRLQRESAEREAKIAIRRAEAESQRSQMSREVGRKERSAALPAAIPGVAPATPRLAQSLEVPALALRDSGRTLAPRPGGDKKTFNYSQGVKRKDARPAGGADGYIASSPVGDSDGTRPETAERSYGGRRAQAVAKPSTVPGTADGTIELSPFSVTASEDKGGYQPAASLAGSRVRTRLNDVGAALSVSASRPPTHVPMPESSLASAPGVAGAAAVPLMRQQAWSAGAQQNVLALEKTFPGGQQQGASLDATERTPEASFYDQVQVSLPTVPPSKMEDAEAVSNRPGQDGELDRVAVPAANPDEVSAAKEPVSTFSLHVSDVSFRLAQAALARGELPDAASVRPEEFYNAFNYGDPSPAMAERISCHIEQAAHPSAQQRNLVRLAMKVPAVGRGAQQPLHLTVLLDTSGSMEREDRAASVRSALGVLVSLLGPADRVTLIGFARQPRLLAEQVAGDQAGPLLDQVNRIPAEGGTNLEEALKLAAELALRAYEPAAQNRIVLLTDGAANLGNANPAALASRVESLRQQGIAFDACGVGLDGIDDGVLEALTRKGDGRYYVLDTPEAADAGFARQLAGAFRPAAENVKVQVRFNPARVGRYRLIGFEKHRLNEEDFRNDKVDAAELAAEEAAIAVYQVEVLPQGEGELGEVYVRFRDAGNGNMVERSWTIHYDPDARTFDQASPSLQLAGVAALIAENLRGGPAGNAVRLEDLAGAVNRLRATYPHEARVQELVTMYQQLRRMRGD